MLYQNDFNSIDFGSPIITNGCSFAASGALTNSIILMPSIIALLWSSFVSRMVFPLRITI
jgi:predicted DNA repair protein MutK